MSLPSIGTLAKVAGTTLATMILFYRMEKAYPAVGRIVRG